MTSPAQVLILGGYGVIGSRVAARMASAFPDRVIVAGRDSLAAEAACRRIGLGSRPRRLDVSDRVSIENGLEGVGTIISCVSQSQPHALHAAIERGLAYTDVAPRLSLDVYIRQRADVASRTGACIVLGAGLSPGISNMMARQLSTLVDQPEHVETAILLGLGDEYGKDSLRHVIDAAAHPFSLHEHGEEHLVQPFSDGKPVNFGAGLGVRTAYLFPWSDVVNYPATLGVRSSVGRFAVNPAWASTACNWLMRAGVIRWLQTKLARRPGRRVPALDAIKRPYINDDRFALVVTMKGRGRELRALLSGRHQADVTAAAAAEFGRMLASHEIAVPGIWLPEQVVPHQAFFERLEASGYRCTIEAGLHP